MHSIRNSDNAMSELLEIENLDVEFLTRRGNIHAAKNVSLQVTAGEVLGLVGESGAGKSTIGNAVIDLLESPGQISGGSIRFNGEELRGKTEDQMRRIRGARIGMIFQDPQTSLNPLLRIGEQLVETIRKTKGIGVAEAESNAEELLQSVGITEARARLRSYPHQFSGGMRQRVVIALALAGDPDLIIADEPTTALDVSVQAQILDLIRGLCKSRNLGVIIVTHDIGVIANIADNVAVMYRGNIVETGSVRQILGNPQHDYTKSLIAAVPRPDNRLHRFNSVDYIDGSGNSTAVLNRIDVNSHWLGQKSQVQQTGAVADSEVSAIEVRELSLAFKLQRAILKRNRRMLQAVDKVSFAIAQGESFGLVGESGSGKSTVARLIAGLHKPDSGSVEIVGQSVLGNQKDPLVKAARLNPVSYTHLTLPTILLV